MAYVHHRSTTTTTKTTDEATTAIIHKMLLRHHSSLAQGRRYHFQLARPFAAVITFVSLFYLLIAASASLGSPLR